jgi:hypothetical protein
LKYLKHTALTILAIHPKVINVVKVGQETLIIRVVFQIALYLRPPQARQRSHNMPKAGPRTAPNRAKLV